jgi:phosphate transport system protein
LDTEGHTSRAFDGAMSSLHLAVVEVGGLVLMQARQAGASYVDRDPALARQVADRHNLVSIRVRAIEETVLALIARRQPVASDLRVILAMSRTAWEYARASGTAARVAAGVSGQGGRAAEGPGQATGRDVRHLAELAQTCSPAASRPSTAWIRRSRAGSSCSMPSSMPSSPRACGA